MTPLLTELPLRQFDGVGGPAEFRICRTHLVRHGSA
jgi:hypothetical protein